MCMCAFVCARLHFSDSKLVHRLISTDYSKHFLLPVALSTSVTPERLHFTSLFSLTVHLRLFVLSLLDHITSLNTRQDP